MVWREKKKKGRGGREERREWGRREGGERHGRRGFGSKKMDIETGRREEKDDRKEVG